MLNQNDLSRYMPHLKAMALMLSRNRALAEDLVQETLVKALEHADQFQAETNLKAWLSTILRNQFFNELRRSKRFSSFDTNVNIPVPTTSGGQEDKVEVGDLIAAFRYLSDSQYEALMLVGAEGFTYMDAAELIKCSVGTVKSRVSRARDTLAFIRVG